MFETLNFETLIEAARTLLTIQVGGITLGPVDTSVLVVALTAALLSGGNLWRLAGSEDRQDRLVILRGGAARDAAREERARRPGWYNRLGSLIASSPIIGIAEQQRLLGALGAAGIKGHADLATFVASKLCAALTLAGFVWLFLEWRHLFAGALVFRIAFVLGALMLGWRLPDIILSRLAARRRRHIDQGMPDALDLLVICAEAGLSLDQAIEQVARDLRTANPAVADEFNITAAEMRVLADRGQALENLVIRTGLGSLRSVTATLTQAIRFGTPLAESMRILAAEMRTERLARLEERAARLPVLLAIPMMLFILPCLLMVIGTPVGLRIGDTLKHIFHLGA